MKNRKIMLRMILDGDPNFVSLVSRGANSVPFRLIKSATSKGTEGMLMFNTQGLFVQKKADEDLAKDLNKDVNFLGYIVNASNGKASDSVQKTSGLTPVKDGNGCVQFIAAEEATEGVMIKLSPDVFAVVKSFEPWGVQGTFADKVNSIGFMPGFHMASDVLTSLVYDTLSTANNPNDTLAAIYLIVKEFTKYVASLVKLLPESAFRLEDDLNQQPALVETMSEKSGEAVSAETECVSSVEDTKKVEDKDAELAVKSSDKADSDTNVIKLSFGKDHASGKPVGDSVTTEESMAGKTSEVAENPQTFSLEKDATGGIDEVSVLIEGLDVPIQGGKDEQPDSAALSVKKSDAEVSLVTVAEDQMTESAVSNLKKTDAVALSDLSNMLDKVFSYVKDQQMKLDAIDQRYAALSGKLDLVSKTVVASVEAGDAQVAPANKRTNGTGVYDNLLIF